MFLAGCEGKKSTPEERAVAGVRRLIESVSREVKTFRGMLQEGTLGRVDMAGRITAYVGLMRGADRPDCPADFEKAYLDYLKAWEQFAEALKTPKADAKTAANEIEQHWDAVLASARTHQAIN
jgi:hypothetical protein